MKVFMIAGEESGDIHGANLIRQLQKLTDVSLYGTGGDNLKSLGQEQYFNIDQMTIIGLDGIVSNIPFIVKMFKTLENKLNEIKPDVVILVDYPGFNLRFAKKAQAAGCKVVYYIAPQIWAWHYSRVHKIRKYVDKILCILPFEEEIFKKEGINATYVGNPVVDNIRYRFKDKSDFLNFYKLKEGKPLIGLLPGSRKREIENLLPVMVEASEKFGNKFQYVLAKAAGVDSQLMDTLLGGSDTVIAENATYDIMRYADLLWVCSGTATLESALNGTPMVLLYKVGKLTEFIGKYVVRTKFIGLPNIIEGKEIIPELLQDEVTAESLCEKTEEIFKNYNDYLEKIKNVKNKFEDKNPSENAAREIYSILYSH